MPNHGLFFVRLYNNLNNYERKDTYTVEWFLP
jgi:hypothetical protein